MSHADFVRLRQWEFGVGSFGYDTDDTPLPQLQAGRSTSRSWCGPNPCLYSAASSPDLGFQNNVASQLIAHSAIYDLRVQTRGSNGSCSTTSLASTARPALHRQAGKCNLGMRCWENT